MVDNILPPRLPGLLHLFLNGELIDLNPNATWTYMKLFAGVEGFEPSTNGLSSPDEFRPHYSTIQRKNSSQ